MMQRRVTAATVSVVLVLAACGGGDDESGSPGDDSTDVSTATAGDGTPTSTPEFRASDVADRYWAAARALEAAHGAEGGFAALMLAFERGYDGEQITGAATAGQIDGDGRIVVDGASLAPSGARAGIVSLPEDDEEGEGASAALSLTVMVAFGPARRGSQVDRADLFAELVIDAEALAQDVFGDSENFDITTAKPTVASALILALAASGYSAEQITDALTQQSILGLETVGETSALTGSCPALRHEDTGALQQPTVPVDTGCRQIVEALARPDEPAAEQEPATEPDEPTSPPEEPEFATYSGEATATAMDAAERASGGYGAVSFEASVDAGVADITITYTHFTWVRGGEDGGPTGDQNCGGIFDVTVAGSGPTGSPTTIPLTVVRYTQVDTVGALCQDGDFDIVLRDPGAGAGRFDGQLNGLGLSGEYSGTVAVAEIQLEASP